MLGDGIRRQQAQHALARIARALLLGALLLALGGVLPPRAFLRACNCCYGGKQQRQKKPTAREFGQYHCGRPVGLSGAPGPGHTY